MKLRWRLIIALALAGILPLIPMLIVVKSAVEVSASSLAPSQVSDALDSGVFLTRTLLSEIRSGMDRRLNSAIHTLSPPPASAPGSLWLPDGEFLYAKQGADWYNYQGGKWVPSAPAETEEAAFGGIPEVLASDTTYRGHEWRLTHNVSDEIRTQALDLQSARAQWTLRRYDRNRLLMSLVLTYLLAHLVVVGLAVGAALIVVVPATRRIERLADVMDAVGEGSDLRARVEGGGEVRRLASAFNLMIDRLEQSRRRAADMEKMAGWRELARVLAHEIKNPLTPIQLSVQQITDSYDGSDERYARLLQTTREIVNEEVESLRRLVREFSDFARAPQLDTAPCPPARIVEELSGLYPGRVECVLLAGDMEIPVDREKLKRALINLVENAFQASGENVPVRISLAQVNDSLRFIVEDNGPGVPDQDRQSIFEPYRTTKSSGIGLGLPIVRSVAQQHGGDAWVERSEALGGAKFVLEIPAEGVVSKAEGLNEGENKVIIQG
ncbi:MAG: HAMP domain-containing sensor histidine kinase [bacterium]